MRPAPISPRQLNRATLARQGLLAAEPIVDLPSLVERMAAVQAQHPDWPPVAIQTRVAAAAPLADVAEARRLRILVRATLMRITVHLVSAADFWPMSALTLPLRADQFRLYFKADPATSPLGRRLAATHPAVLAAMRERPRSIAEIESIMRSEAGDIEIPPNRSLWRHFSGSVPLVMVPFEGEASGRARYVPAVDWLGQPAGAADQDAAATAVAERYLAAFGPASVEDFAAFVGRGKGLGRLRAAVERLGDRLVQFEDEAGRTLLDLADAPRPPQEVPAPPRLLARWDSVLLAYAPAHRTRVLPEERRASVITRNGDVLPTFLVDGRVAGTWLPRRAEDGRAWVELRPFDRLAAATRRALEAEAERLLPAMRGGVFSRYPGTD